MALEPTSRGKRVAVLGDGGWGTALALTLQANGCEVCVWGPFPDIVKTIAETRTNTWYLPGVALPPEVGWTADRARAAAGADLVVMAVPSTYYREVAESFRGLVPASVPVVSVAKGLDGGTGQRLSDVAAEALGVADVAVLSGPSHAEEVARGIPTAVVAACADVARAAAVQATFMNARFRVYTSDDVAGVELGGALKNVIAIAVGVSDGLGFGDNTRAALITRGLAEMARLGVACGAHAGTFQGLSGMGDLIVTCASGLSRNRAVGERLGRGEPIDAILGSMKQVAEGVANCRRVRDLARRAGVSMPIAEQVCAVIYEGRSPGEAVDALLSREAKPERDA